MTLGREVFRVFDHSVLFSCGISKEPLVSVQTFTRFPKLDGEGEEIKAVLFLREIILRWSVGGEKVSSFFLLLNYETGFSTWDQLFPQIKLKSQTYWICSGRGSFRSLLSILKV